MCVWANYYIVVDQERVLNVLGGGTFSVLGKLGVEGKRGPPRVCDSLVTEK